MPDLCEQCAFVVAIPDFASLPKIQAACRDHFRNHSARAQERCQQEDTLNLRTTLGRTDHRTCASKRYSQEPDAAVAMCAGRIQRVMELPLNFGAIQV